MQMSDGEILQRWNNAVDKKVHVEILADLNAVDKRTMHKKLLELGAEGVPPMKERKKTEETKPKAKRKPVYKVDEMRAMELYSAGACDLDMAEALGVSRNTVADWRKKHDLKCHRQAPGYVQQEIPKNPQDRTGQDRTGGALLLGRRRLWGSRNIWESKGCCA